MPSVRRADLPSGSACADVLLVHRLPPPPTLPRPPARIRFPLIAVVAPVIGAVVIGLVTGSPFVLVFAVLSPLIAIATVLDGRRAARRERRDEAERFDRECRAYSVAIARAHAVERAEADARHPLAAAAHDESRAVRLGTAPARSAAAPEEVLLPGDSADEVRLRAMIARARRHDGLPVVVPRGPVAVNGSGLAADAIERRLTAEPGVAVVRLAEGENPPPGAVLVRVRSATDVTITTADGGSVTAVPEFIGRPQLAAATAQHSSRLHRDPPGSVRWRDLEPTVAMGETASTGIGVPVGLDGGGSVLLDLEREGPHALVGGTTGSGKSEFLRALALGWAATRSPSELTLLFVDFKGGATFAGLTDLPHTVGLVTDLDPLVAERALLSLRAELRRRERVLAEAGLRDIAQQPELLARLIVLVDEFAALIDAFPELHAPFADLSARGRSLGVHLVLCTQNPAGAVRDAVAANCAVRIAFRLSATAGAGFIGAEGRELAGAPAGRAVIVTAEGARTVQIATIDDDDIAAVRQRWAGVAPASSPWAPPLPESLDLTQLEQAVADRGGVDEGATPSSSLEPSDAVAVPALAFGVLDDPAEQRRLPAAWHSARDGALAVVGAPRSGRSTALAALAESARRAGSAVTVLPGSVTEAWALLESLGEQPIEAGLLLADDLDLLLADAGDLAPELLARWDAAVRAMRRAGGGAAATIGPASSARGLLGARFESRLLLRCLDADDHQLAGAPRGLFDRAAPPGRGWWTDRQVQVVEAPLQALVPTRCPAVPWLPPADRDVVVVTRRVASMAAAVQQAHPLHRVVIDPAREPLEGAADLSTAPHIETVQLAPRILIADPEGWQSAWALFTSLRRTAPVVVARSEAADLRALLGQRTTPPPLDEREGEVWVVEPGEPVRRRSWTTLAAG